MAQFGTGFLSRTVTHVAFVLLFLMHAGVDAQAQSGDCRQPDPERFEDVFACMMSARRENAIVKGSVFERAAITSCESAAMLYQAEIVRARVPRNEAYARIPSCTVLARALEQIRGTPQPWAACTEYPGRFDPEHMRACLASFLPGYYGRNRTLQSLAGCQDATSEYEKALTAATISRLHANGHAMIRRALPENYQKPDCTLLAGIVGDKGSACLGYEPGMAHVRQCMGIEATRYTDCLALRGAYEQKLRQAYGGSFPESYTAIQCGEAKELLAEAQARKDQRTIKPQREARTRVRQETDLVAWARYALWGGGRYGLAVHAILAIAALFYARTMIRRGTWIRLTHGLKNLFPHSFRVKLNLAHIVIAFFGAQTYGWRWLAGAALGLIVAAVVAFVMVMKRQFENPIIEAGPVNAPSRPSGCTQSQHVDGGRSDKWL